jgi:glyoxylase-like metal-dependent hydrolase (beta-lactamase superfamily II)
MELGRLRVDAVIDGNTTPPAEEVLQRPGVPNAWDAHRDLLSADGRLELTIGAFLVRSSDRVMLIDAGVGPIDNDRFKGGQLLTSLAGLGIRPEDVTDVLLTHLHYDHVGWVTQRGAIVFPAATYRCHADDWDYFVSRSDADAGALRKLSPVGPRLETFDSDRTVAPGVDVRHAPGHTPGSTIVVLSSGTARAMLIGDVVHCPIQLTEDDWVAAYDLDPQMASLTRQALARELEADGSLVAPAHFPGLQFGRLLTGQAGRRWTVG